MMWLDSMSKRDEKRIGMDSLYLIQCQSPPAFNRWGMSTRRIIFVFFSVEGIICASPDQISFNHE